MKHLNYYLSKGITKMKKNSLSVYALILTIYALPVYAQQVRDNSQEEKAKKNEENADLRLSLAKVTLYSETNQIDKAFSLIDQLKTDYPDEPQILLAEADLNLRIENRGSAFADIQKAQMLRPTDEDIMARKRAMFKDLEPFASVGASVKRTNQATEKFVTAGAQAYYDPTLSAGIIFENDSLKSKADVVRVDGTAEPFDSDRQRATLSMGKLFNGGHGADGFLYLGNDNIGGGLQFSLWDRSGTTSLQANLNQPDWTFIETVVGKGTKDNISLTRKQRFRNNFDLSLGGSLNRYNLEDDSDVAKSVSLDFYAGYNYPVSFSETMGDDINLGINYGLGAEYFKDKETKLSPGGGTFQPLPAETYEVHSLTVSASKNFTPDLNLDAYAGYAVDRFGDDGPLFGAGLTYSPVKNISLEVLGSRGIMGENRIGTVDQYSVNLKWKW
jgi:hypothetical protein